MANLKTSCIRKGVVIGQASVCMNELYSQFNVFDEIDVPMTKTTLKDLRALVSPLRKNFKGAHEAVTAIENGTKRLEQAIKAKPGVVPPEHLKAEAKELRQNLRKVIRTAFTECGKSNPTYSDVIDWTGDYAYFADEKQG